MVWILLFIYLFCEFLKIHHELMGEIRPTTRLWFSEEDEWFGLCRAGGNEKNLKKPVSPKITCFSL